MSILLVVPYLSSNKELYGIYLFVSSLTVFLTYGDFGFLTAGQKFAGEAFSRNDKDSEYQILGFTFYVFLIFTGIFSFLALLFYFKPSLFFSDLNPNNIYILRGLLLVYGVIFPINLLFQKIYSSVLSIRLKEFKAYRLEVLANIVKSLSVLIFFKDGNYLIVEFVLFGQIMNLLVALVVLKNLRLKEDFHLNLLLRKIRYSKEMYFILKDLALSTLLSTIAWILYYELDLFYLGLWSSSNDVATYGVCIVLLNFVRSLWNIYYGPVFHLFNPLVVNNHPSWKEMFKVMLALGIVLNFVFSCFLVLNAERVIIYWLGLEYLNSIQILQILMIYSFTFSLIQPLNFLATILNEFKFIRNSSIFLIILFSFTALVLVPGSEGLGLAISKSITSLIFTVLLLVKFTDTLNFKLSWSIILKFIPLTLLIILPQLFIDAYFIDSNSQSYSSLIVLILCCFIHFLLIIFTLYFTAPHFRSDLKFLFNSLKNIE